MIRNISRKVTDRLVSRSVIEDEEYEIYQYGLEQLFTNLLNLVTLLVIGISIGMIWQGIIFVLAFMSMRKYAGGYHSTTPLRCYFLTNIVILSMLSVMKYMEINIFIYWGLFIVSSIIILELSPVEIRLPQSHWL